MEAILRQINAVPGVLGSLVCSDEGELVAQAFSSAIDGRLPHEAASILADMAIYLQGVSAGVRTIDFRFDNARIVAKPISTGFLLLLCDKTINLQLLNISTNVAVKKIEKLVTVSLAAAASVPSVQKAPQGSPLPQAAGQLRRDGKGVVLTVDTMRTAANTNWNQMEEQVAIGRGLAGELAELIGADAFKKIKLTNRTTGRSKAFRFITIERDEGSGFDDRIVLTLAAIEVLQVKPGDEVTAEPVAGGGLFG